MHTYLLWIFKLLYTIYHNRDRFQVYGPLPEQTFFSPLMFILFEKEQVFDSDSLVSTISRRNCIPIVESLIC